MPKVQVTSRLETALYVKLVSVAHEAGLSINQVASAFLARALEEGWTVKPGQPEAIRGDDDG